MYANDRVYMLFHPLATWKLPTACVSVVTMIVKSRAQSARLVPFNFSIHLIIIRNELIKAFHLGRPTQLCTKIYLGSLTSAIYSVRLGVARANNFLSNLHGMSNGL